MPRRSHPGFRRSLSTLVILVVLVVVSRPASATVDPVGAAAVFAEAEVLCARDAGALWGHSLCGPILLVDPVDRAIVTNGPDAGGVLQKDGAVFTGVLPPAVIVANTTIEWSGTRWTEMFWPLPADPARRHVLIAHELFHRLQDDLHLPKSDGGNAHLDTLQGRYLLQLEWRALAQALRTSGRARRSAIADALLFRAERYRSFADAAHDEAALEGNEGIAEYTGVRAGLDSAQARTAYAIQDLSAFVDAPTFVRAFAYATGPAYGLLLDAADPDWRTTFASGARFDERLAAALRLSASPSTSLAARERAYDDGTLLAREGRRDDAQRARSAALTAKLVDGPVLVLPLAKASYQFNPQTLRPLGAAGVVYPTIRLSDAWGVLEVDDDALLDRAMTRAAVSATGIDPSGARGAGWRLALKPGWVVRAGERAGDFVVARDPGSP